MSMIAKKSSLPFVFGILLLGFVSCNKIGYTEHISFPKEVQLVKGQKCILKCAVDNLDGDGVSYYMSQIGDSTVLGSQNDTIVALAKGESFVERTVYTKTGQYDARCLVEVREPLPMPNPTNTVFAHDGDTVCFHEFETIETHDFHVECESVGQNHIGKVRCRINTDEYRINSNILFCSSPRLTHNVSAQVHEGDTAIRIYCDSLFMSVRIPVVVLHDEKNEDYN